MTTATARDCDFCGTTYIPGSRPASARFCRVNCKNMWHQRNRRQQRQEVRETAMTEALAQLEVTLTPHRRDGLAQLAVEWTIPTAAYELVSSYCARHHLDVETYLADVAGEVLVKRQAELESRKRKVEKARAKAQDVVTYLENLQNEIAEKEET